MRKLSYLILVFSSAFLSCSKEESNLTAGPTEKILEIKTSFGNMYMWLYKETPLHRNNYLALADTHYFDNSTFHRIIPNFVIQGGDPNSKDGDPNNDGQGGPGYTIPAEIDSSKFKHIYGAVGAARLGNSSNPLRASSGSQFYIVVNTLGQKSLDGEYTVFGKIIGGMNIADIIAAQPKNSNNRPFTNINMYVNVVNKTLTELKNEFQFTP